MIATLQCAVKKQGQVTLHYTSRDVLQTSQSSKTLSSEPSTLVYDNNGNEVPLGCPARHLSLRHQASEPGEAGHGQGAPQGGEVLEAMLLKMATNQIPELRAMTGVSAADARDV